MCIAVACTAKGAGHTRPNPAVGAVIAKDDKIIGYGWHKRAGGDHAEVAALKDARKRAPGVPDVQLFANATLFVTLEPCSKPGRVGACTDAIIAAGLKRVIWACPDPNPTNRGKAKRVLRRAGIACECWATDRRTGEGAAGRRGVVEGAARALAPFLKHVTTGLPYVTVKLAMSLDGKICDDFGEARWVSSAEARKVTGTYREVVDVMMVGAETVRRDNPSLLCHTRKNDDLWRAIVSKSGRLPRTAQVFTDDAKERTLVYRDAVEAIRDLGRRGFMHVLCEGGLKLATALAEAGLVDEWITVLAPKVIGTRPIGQAVKFRTGGCKMLDARGTLLASFGRTAPGALA